MCAVLLVGCLEGLSPRKKSPVLALSQSARGVRVLVGGKLKPAVGWSKRVLRMVGIALLGVASRAAEVGGPETVAQPIIKIVQAPAAAAAGMPHSGGAEVQGVAAFGAEEVVAGLLQEQEQVGEIGSEELAVPVELAAGSHEQVHESEAKGEAAEGQVSVGVGGGEGGGEEGMTSTWQLTYRYSVCSVTRGSWPRTWRTTRSVRSCARSSKRMPD
jgi:hypothetical protein